MKQTPLEWLKSQMPVINWADPYWKEKLDKANAMFEEQIREAFCNGETSHDRIDAEQYYQETYKSQDK